MVTTINDNGTVTPARRVYLMLDDNSFNYTQDFLISSQDGSIIPYSSYTDIRTDRMTECDILYYDEEYDFAIIKANSKVDRIALELAESEEESYPGEQVWLWDFQE